jgi:hypothetical protein
MAEFKITWQEERSAVVEVTDIRAVEITMFDKIKHCTNPEAVKLLSIHRIDPTPPPLPAASAA